ncbi:MAG: Uma2 family endonuclease [Saprospiraceae bacterium]
MVAEILAKKIVQSYSLEEYLELEEKAAYKSEFRNGKIVKITEGTFAHTRLISNIFKLLGRLEDDTFETLSSDQTIFIPAYNQAVYSDTLVIKGEPEFYEGNNHVIINPTLIVEVLSNSTERYDRSRKFRKYQSLTSFQEYILIDQHMPIVDVLYKEGERDWRMRTYVGLEEAIHFKSIDVTLKMADIYKKVEDLRDPQTVLEFDGEEE